MIYACFMNQYVYWNCNMVTTAILFKQFISLKPVFHSDIFYTLSKIGMCGLLYILTYSF